MSVEISKLIAAVSPDVYCDSSVRKKVKEIAKKEGYLNAADEAKAVEEYELFQVDEANRAPLECWGLRSPTESHSITYDSPSEGLEPLYFWLLDYLNGVFGGDVDKIVDNFISSPGSAHFNELMGRASQMQQESSRTLANVNTVIKGILNLIYDLKDFKLKLQPYDDFKSEDPKKKEAALFSLKQVWMDNVDIKRGQGSINALAAGNLQFVTLRDAFLAARSLDMVDKIDLNDKVKRILKPRIAEFFMWRDESEKSLRQRFEIERHYLKTQVNTVKLYSRWVKPYLKAAKDLEQNVSPQAALVSTFNTMILELTLLARGKYDPVAEVNDGTLPRVFEKVKARKYIPIVLVEFSFRGIPQRVSQKGDWGFGGKTDIKFSSYVLNEDELTALKETIEEDDFGDVMNLIEGVTKESLDQMKDDLDEFMKSDEEREAEKNKKEDVNPFLALFDFLRKREKPEEKGKKIGKNIIPGRIKPDSVYEKVIRSQAIIEAREKCFKTFDTYKKAHSMPSYPNPYDLI